MNIAGFWRMVKLFGWSYKATWRTLFPPFKGWDIGCGYCYLEAESIKRRVCPRGYCHKYKQCGVTGD